MNAPDTREQAQAAQRRRPTPPLRRQPNYYRDGFDAWVPTLKERLDAAVFGNPEQAGA